MRAGDTIVAAATAPGRGVRGMVRVSGPGTREVLGGVLEGPERVCERGSFAARLSLGEAGAALPVLVAMFRGPGSYTGEDSAEILMPGNPWLIERVLARLARVDGVRLAEPGEFTARAYLSGRMTLDRAEGVAAVIAAETEHELVAARELLGGATGAAYRAWAEELTTLLALTEAGIDFTDQEDVVAIAPGELRRRLRAVDSAIEGHTGAGTGTEAVSGLARVVLAGEPNAGKSTLFNALLGRERAVVSPVAGTTRDAIEEELDLTRDLPGAGSVMLVDLAGVDGGLVRGVELEAQAAAREAIGRADVVVQCDPGGWFAALAEAFGKTIIRVRTKADVPGAVAGESDGSAVPVCALDGWNLAVLRRAIADSATGGRGCGVGALVPRHRRALGVARAGIAGALAVLVADEARIAEPELVAGALRGALDGIGELVGRISPDDVIGRVFATFCVGK